MSRAVSRGAARRGKNSAAGASTTDIGTRRRRSSTRPTCRGRNRRRRRSSEPEADRSGARDSRTTFRRPAVEGVAAGFDGADDPLNERVVENVIVQVDAGDGRFGPKGGGVENYNKNNNEAGKPRFPRSHVKLPSIQPVERRNL